MRPRLFCEFPAGLASVSLRLQGGAHCRPPISRMGNKQGYAKLILGTLGLHSGQGAGGYWWAEADADVAALLRIYPDPAAFVGEVLLDGRADIAIQQVPELLAAGPGIELAALLPAELQKMSVLSAGVFKTSAQAVAGRCFIDFLATPASLQTLKAAGFDPI